MSSIFSSVSIVSNEGVRQGRGVTKRRRTGVMVMLRNFRTTRFSGITHQNREQNIEYYAEQRYGAWGENAGTKLDDFQVRIVYSVVKLPEVVRSMYAPTNISTSHTTAAAAASDSHVKMLYLKERLIMLLFI